MSATMRTITIPEINEIRAMIERIVRAELGMPEDAEVIAYALEDGRAMPAPEGWGVFDVPSHVVFYASRVRDIVDMWTLRAVVAGGDGGPEAGKAQLQAGRERQEMVDAARARIEHG